MVIQKVLMNIQGIQSSLGQLAAGTEDVISTAGAAFG